MEEDLLCCRKCGGTNVEQRVWADANTQIIFDDTSIKPKDTWCRDCEEHTGLEFQSEHLK